MQHGGQGGRRRGVIAVAVVLAAVAVGVAGKAALDGPRPAAVEGASVDDGAGEPGVSPPTTGRPSDAGTWSPSSGVGAPYGATVDGILTFRGNPTRTWYGSGPIAGKPSKDWRFPAAGKLCSLSSDPKGTREWCGTGWTGQPAVFERGGRTWLVVGAYDRAVHFLDAATGERLLPDFPTGDLIKGSVTVDPDGYPLVYVGSRDGNYRVLSIDGSSAKELWRLRAGDVRPVLWNDDWDGSGLVLRDHLLVGGENSHLHAVKLGRAYDAAGAVTVSPRLVWHAPGWDDELLRDLGDRNVSFEGSVAVSGDTLYAANSGGLVQGWDIGGLERGVAPTRTFRFWSGDDTDASVVVDDEGMLYVASEWERQLPRGESVGQVVKLDPRRSDPVVWSFADRTPRKGKTEKTAGVWATPAIDRDVVYVATDGG
ncbi:MAG TPA: WD40 repeat domain-containing protein, partial [Acidimicrobiales bacterium]